MYKNGLIAFGMMMLATSAYANHGHKKEQFEEFDTTIHYASKKVICGSYQEMFDALREAGSEIKEIMGETQDPDNPKASAVVSLLINEEHKTFTIVEIDNTGNTCMISGGRLQ